MKERFVILNPYMLVITALGVIYPHTTLASETASQHRKAAKQVSVEPQRSHLNIKNQRNTISPSEMTAEQFDAWIAATSATFTSQWQDAAQRPANSVQPPTILRTVLLQRLHSEKFTTDDAVMSVVNIYILYETYVSKEQLFPESKRLIDDVLLTLYKRPELSAKLHLQKGNLYGTAEDAKNAVPEFDLAVGIFDPLHISIDLQREKTLVAEGDGLYRLNDKAEAENVYLEALSYLYFKVQDPVAFNALKKLYIQAGKGLINCRQNDLAKLKDTMFIPSAQRELQPYLDQAILAAGGKPESHK